MFAERKTRHGIIDRKVAGAFPLGGTVYRGCFKLGKSEMCSKMLVSSVTPALSVRTAKAVPFGGVLSDKRVLEGMNFFRMKCRQISTSASVSAAGPRIRPSVRSRRHSSAENQLSSSASSCACDGTSGHLTFTKHYQGTITCV